MKILALLAALTLAAETQSLSGNWQILLHGDHKIPMGMELKQEESKLNGTITFMGKDIPVTGDIKGEELTLKGEMADPPMKLNFTGKANEDGTLTGSVNSPHGVMKWTAERFRTRKAKNEKP